MARGNPIFKYITAAPGGRIRVCPEAMKREPENANLEQGQASPRALHLPSGGPDPDLRCGGSANDRWADALRRSTPTQAEFPWDRLACSWQTRTRCQSALASESRTRAR